MIDRLKPRSEFSRNVVTLMTGTTVAQAIPVAISPILTRLYGPEDFGVLALFVALTSIFGAIANGRYELAVMLPESDDDALNVAALGLLIAAALSFLLLCIAVAFNGPISALLGNGDIGPWLYLVPLTVLFMGLFNALNYYNNRLKQYRDIARAGMLKSVVLAATQLGLGFLKVGAGGLVAGQVLSALFANAKLLRNTLRHANWRTAVRRERMLALGARYRDFPKYSMPAILANTLSQQLTNILVSAFFSVATLGYYSLVQRMLGVPSLLIGTAVSQVFFQAASSERRQCGNSRRIFDRTLLKLIILVVPISLCLYIFVPKLFGFVFGREWIPAGEYAKIMVPLFAARFVSAPLSVVMSVHEKQKQSLLINLLVISQVGICFLVSSASGGDIESLLWMLSVSGSFLYLLFVGYYRKVSSVHVA